LVHVTQGETIALLDTTITPELKRAGIARDVNRFIQDARKANGFEVSDRISVTWQSDDDVIVAAITEHRDALMEWTLATSFEQGDHADASESKLGKSVIGLHLSKA
jgi:isoleucyl-tRNA synthetase